MKKIVASVLGLTMIFGGMVNAEMGGSLARIEQTKVFEEVVINNRTSQLTVPGQSFDGITYLPVRQLAEELGYQVTWHQATKEVVLQKEKQIIKFNPGSLTYDYQVDKKGQGKQKTRIVPLSAVSRVVNQRTMVPAEFFNVLLGVDLIKRGEVIKVGAEPLTVVGGTIISVEPIKGGRMVTIAPLAISSQEEHLMLLVSEDTIINGKPLTVGQSIIAYTAMARTMSSPPQTVAKLIYSFSDFGPLVGRILGIDGNKLSVLSGDIMVDVEVDSMEAKKFYLNQWVIAYDTGRQTVITPHHQIDYQHRHANMGQPIYDVTGVITSIDDKSLTIDTGQRKVVSSYNGEDVKIGDKVMLTYIDMGDYQVTAALLKQKNRYHLMITGLKRMASGELVLSTETDKGTPYEVILAKGSIIKCDMTDLLPNTKIVIYTDGNVSSSKPASLNARMVEIVK